jgi:hypothetical protein
MNGKRADATAGYGTESEHWVNEPVSRLVRHLVAGSRIVFSSTAFDRDDVSTSPRFGFTPRG